MKRRKIDFFTLVDKEKVLSRLFPDTIWFEDTDGYMYGMKTVGKIEMVTDIITPKKMKRKCNCGGKKPPKK